MLDFMSNPENKIEDINGFIDITKLKKEINDLSKELIFLKKKIRDPKLNLAVKNNSPIDKLKDFWATFGKRDKIKLRFNKLVTFRSLMRGKMHFHKNTRISQIDYRLKGLTKEYLWDWVEDVKEEFKVK